MELFVGIVLLLVLLVVVAVLVGRSLPVGHIASRTVTFRAAPQQVWEAVNDPKLMASRGVGDVTFEVVESVPPKLLKTRVVGERDFGGTWTCEIAPAANGGSTLTITENGEIYSSFFRFVSRFIIGHHRTIDGTMAALRKRFRES